MSQAWILPFPTNTDHIKPRLTAMQAVTGEVVQSGLGDLPLFAGVDRRQWIAKGLTCMGAHLDKDDRLSIQGNEVNLSERGTVIFRDDGIALSRKKLFG